MVVFWISFEVIGCERNSFRMILGPKTIMLADSLRFLLITEQICYRTNMWFWAPKSPWLVTSFDSCSLSSSSGVWKSAKNHQKIIQILFNHFQTPQNPPKIQPDPTTGSKTVVLCRDKKNLKMWFFCKILQTEIGELVSFSEYFFEKSVFSV